MKSICMNKTINKYLLLSAVIVAALSTFQTSAVAKSQTTTATELNTESHVQFIRYDDSKAIVIKTKRGFATHIDLEADEHIAKVGGGDSDGWLIEATVGANFIFLKPKSSAHDSNIVLKTDKRSYAFDLRILKDHAPERGTWRLAFIYAKPTAEIPSLTAAQIEDQNKAQIKELQAVPQPKRNTQYSMQVMPKSDEISPTAAWDDGNFTYLRIPNHREIPAVFRVTADGSEAMVNTHMEGDNKDVVVIHGVAKHYVLRLSKQVVGVWNEAYDIEGVSPKAGTVTSGVSRKVAE